MGRSRHVHLRGRQAGHRPPDPRAQAVALTDEALLAREAALQAEASTVLVELDLLARLETIGRPVQTGSVALGLMVWRDIDVTVLCPSLDVGPVFDIGRSLAGHPHLRKLGFRNDTGRWNTDPDYPDGLYWGLEYRVQAGEAWNLDLWFLLDGTTQFDLQHLATLPTRLTPETRLAILRIKDAWHGRPEYRTEVRSYDIYEAVLDHGVRTTEAFAAYLAHRQG